MQTLSANADVSIDTGALPTRRVLGIAAIFIVCYVALALATRFYLVRPFGITPWNPSAGLALALLLIFGYRWWPALAVATCIANLLIRGIPSPPFLQLLLPLTITVAYAGMAVFLRGPLGFRLEFDRLRDVFALLAVAALGTLLVAITFVSVIRLGNLIPATDIQHTVMRSWIGHLLGILINTPLLLMLANWQRTTRVLRQLPLLEIAAQVCSVVFTLWFIFASGWADPYKQFYLLFLPLIWIAMRHAIVGATFGLAVMQLGFIAFIVRANYDAGTSVTELQFMMLALVVTGLLLGMVVAENRAARQALDDSEARVRAIVSTAPDSIITVGQHGHIVAANPAAARIFGCAAGELVGKRVYDVLPDFEQVARVGEACELTGVRTDGTRFPAELSVGTTANELPALRIAVTRDITRRKAMERQLGRAARLAAAGEMAAALAHELHQPLCAIRNYAHAARLQQAPADASELPEKIEHEAARAADIVQRLRDFFRDGSSSFEYLSVQHLLDGALAPMREDAAKQAIAVSVDVACGNVDLLVDRVQLEAVIHSLVGNAFDSISGAGQRVRTVRVSAQQMDDGWVRVSVADSGPGINLEIANRLFEPFATTKITGIGMGLAMSRAIVEAYDGKLWVEQDAGGGAVFHFTVPPANFKDDADDAE